MATIEEIVNKDLEFSKNSPEYELNIRNKFKGYNLVFSFPTCPVEEEKYLAFPAYVKSVADKYSVGYSSREVYGRMDPIPIYSRTQRSISFSLDIPSYGLLQSRENARKLDILVKNLYPTYEKSGNTNIIASPPLARIFFSNFIHNNKPNSTSRSLLGYFPSGIDITHDLSKGVFARNEGYEAYAKSYTLSFSFNVLHEYTPGYQMTNGKMKNPVNILQGSR